MRLYAEHWARGAKDADAHGNLGCQLGPLSAGVGGFAARLMKSLGIFSSCSRVHGSAPVLIFGAAVWTVDKLTPVALAAVPEGYEPPPEGSEHFSVIGPVERGSRASFSLAGAVPSWGHGVGSSFCIFFDADRGNRSEGVKKVQLNLHPPIDPDEAEANIGYGTLTKEGTMGLSAYVYRVTLWQVYQLLSLDCGHIDVTAGGWRLGDKLLVDEIAISTRG